jgi:hypothetical protein
MVDLPTGTGSMSVDEVLALARPEAGEETGDPIDGSERTKR